MPDPASTCHLTILPTPEIVIRISVWLPGPDRPRLLLISALRVHFDPLLRQNANARLNH
jgi:hypothetical protein